MVTKAAPSRFSLRWTLIGLAALLAIIVVLQNTQAVETRVLFTTITMPRALLLALALLLGFAAGYVLAHRRGTRADSNPGPADRE